MPGLSWPRRREIIVGRAAGAAHRILVILIRSDFVRKDLRKDERGENGVHYSTGLFSRRRCRIPAASRVLERAQRRCKRNAEADARGRTVRNRGKDYGPRTGSPPEIGLRPGSRSSETGNAPCTWPGQAGARRRRLPGGRWRSRMLSCRFLSEHGRTSDDRSRSRSRKTEVEYDFRPFFSSAGGEGPVSALRSGILDVSTAQRLQAASPALR